MSVTLRHPGGARAEIVPAHGALLNRFKVAHEGVTYRLLEPSETLPAPWGELRGSPVMFPFPGRVTAGRYRTQGRTFDRLPLNDPDLGVNHIHGLVSHLPWRLEASSDTTCTCTIGHHDLPAEARAGYPFPFQLELTFTLAADRLTIGASLDNPGDTLLPFGFGLHPYFALPFTEQGTRGGCLLELNAPQHWLQEAFAPTGTREALEPSLDLRTPRRVANIPGAPPNYVYALAERDPERPLFTLTDPFAGARLEATGSEDISAVVLYVPPEANSICVEPQSCIPNAVNLHQQHPGTGWLELEPAGRWRWRSVLAFIKD